MGIWRVCGMSVYCTNGRAAGGLDMTKYSERAQIQYSHGVEVRAESIFFYLMGSTTDRRTNGNDGACPRFPEHGRLKTVLAAGESTQTRRRRGSAGRQGRAVGYICVYYGRKSVCREACRQVRICARL